MEAAKTTQNPMREKLLTLNQHHSESFQNSKRSREIHRQNHPLEIGVMKCMDGRVHVPVMTNTPLGIIQPWRNIGGKFNLGWPHYKDTIREWTRYAASKGRPSLVFATYHFARGFEGEDAEVVKHRGCAGHEYNTENAKAGSLALKEQFDAVYRNDSLYAIQCGIETDLDALILHGAGDQVVDLAEAKFSTELEIMEMLQSLYPQIPRKVLSDMLPMITGNIEHIEYVRKSNRPKADSEHRERVLALGRGFDWLHEPNLALIISPYDPDLHNIIIKAAGLLQQNLDTGRVKPEEGMALLVSAPFREKGEDERLAEQKAKWLTEYTTQILDTHVPELLKHMDVITATCDMETRGLKLL